MALAFALGGLAIIALLKLVHRPMWFVILTGFTFFAWGEIFSLFPATIGDIFGPKYATINYGIQYTAKGTASIFAGWGAAKILELMGSWIPVLWIAVACDLPAAFLALVALKPLVARRMVHVKLATAPTVPVAAGATGDDSRLVRRLHPRTRRRSGRPCLASLAPACKWHLAR
jgi:MFS family permease